MKNSIVKIKIYSTYSFSILLLTFVSILGAGCEKEISVDLKQAPPRHVIEARLISGKQQFKVYVSQSGSYFNSPKIRYLENAKVTLFEISPEGEVKTFPCTLYTQLDTAAFYSPAIEVEGKTGYTYRLRVEIENQIYEAEGMIRRVPSLQALTYQLNEETNILREKGYYYITLMAQEPPGTGDYYRFRFYRNGILFNNPEDWEIAEDRYVDGKFIIWSPARLKFSKGDTATVEICSIDQITYKYILGLRTLLLGQGNPFSPVPTNPINNFRNLNLNGKPPLGFFFVEGVEKASVVIQ
ncbi:MAG: DUF4249 family protein [Bacteroidia bacterium]|nr:DUF4249 domain-containing protein [Bacteroidia bacterium]MDW8157677.1 DUF4249 family protein [Bacteroidia bacterium]